MNDNKVLRILKNDIKNLSIFTYSARFPDNETIFQYSGPQTLERVLDSQCIWATQVSHLNDSTEFILLLDVLKRLSIQEKANFSNLKFNRAVEDFLKRASTPIYDMFVACFSKTGDLLTVCAIRRYWRVRRRIRGPSARLQNLHRN